RGLAERDPQVVHQIVAVAHEPRIVFHLHDDHDVATGAAPRTGIALAAQRDVIPGGHARRHLDVDRLLGRREPAPAALLAAVLDQLTFTTACGARRDAHHLPQDRTLHAPQLPRAAARPAPHERCAACRPRARARGAWVHDRN